MRGCMCSRTRSECLRERSKTKAAGNVRLRVHPKGKTAIASMTHEGHVAPTTPDFVPEGACIHWCLCGLRCDPHLAPLFTPPIDQTPQTFTNDPVGFGDPIGCRGPLGCGDPTGPTDAYDNGRHTTRSSMSGDGARRGLAPLLPTLSATFDALGFPSMESTEAERATERRPDRGRLSMESAAEAPEPTKNASSAALDTCACAWPCACVCARARAQPRGCTSEDVSMYVHVYECDCVNV